MTIGMFDVLSTWLLLLMIILTSNAPNRDEEREPQELKPIVNVLLANAEPDTNWIPLFNGQDLSGWEHMGKGRFVVEEGLLKTEGGLGLLWYTEKKLRDVVIKVVYRNPGGSNSGVFIRIPYPPREGVWKPVHNGYEVQIDDTDDEYHITGVLYSFTKAMAFPAKPGEWNVMEITLDDHRTIVEVNGVTVTDYTEGDPVRKKPWWLFWKFWTPKRGARPIEGYVGLQNHGKRDLVYFKEVSYRPLAREK